MLTKKRLIAMALPVALGGGAVAVAATTGPSAQSVAFEMTFDRAVVHERLCTDAEGNEFFSNRGIYYGTASGSEGFNGTVEAHVRGFGGGPDGASIDQGTFRVRAANGGWTAQGRIADAADDATTKGVLIGETRVPPSGAGARGTLVANFEIGFAEGRGLLLRSGTDEGTSALPATVTTGRCTGPEETYVIDFTEVPEEARAAAATHASWGR